MKKDTTILDMYYDFCENGIPNGNGLCEHFRKFKYWDLLEPTIDDELELRENDQCIVYWGNPTTTYNGPIGDQSVMTPLRQNIVLLMACLNGEL